MSDPVVVVAQPEQEGQLQDYSVDQLGGFVVMVAGAIGSLLLVVWQSKCHCRMNLCYIFQCERRPPSEEEMKSLKDQSKAYLKGEKDKKNKNKKTTPGPPSRTSKDKLYDIESPTDEEFNDPETEPEPEPEPEPQRV